MTEVHVLGFYDVVGHGQEDLVMTSPLEFKVILCTAADMILLVIDWG